MKRVARIFPRKTKATPDDALCFFGYPRDGEVPDVDEIHVSATFTSDIPKAECLANAWTKKSSAPVLVGGPAYKKPAGEFEPGLYLKNGYVITSRGCPNHCWHCGVHTYQPFVELPIKDGWIVQDDNLLACSEDHIRKVFQMLSRQPERPTFSGGLEAKLLKPWHVDLLLQAKPSEMFFAYDTPDDRDPLFEAGKMLLDAGFTLRKRKSYAYVLMGYLGDTFEKAERRCIDTLKAGFMPFAMLYMDESGFQDPTWDKFKRSWCRPAAIVSSNKEFFARATS